MSSLIYSSSHTSESHSLEESDSSNDSMKQLMSSQVEYNNAHIASYEEARLK